MPTEILDVTCIDQILFGDQALTLKNINISLYIVNFLTVRER